MVTSVKKGIRVIGEARENLAQEVQDRYKSGASIRTLAAETGRSYGFIHRLLSENSVELRGRGGATREPRASS